MTGTSLSGPSRAATQEEVEDALLKDVDSMGSAALGSLVDRLTELRQKLGRYAPGFYEGFDARSLTELETGWESTLGGAASVSLAVDDLPSAVRLNGGGTAGDTAMIESWRTVSLQGTGNTKIIFEFRAKLNREDQLDARIALRNTNNDRIELGLYAGRNWGTGDPLHGLVAWTNGARSATGLDLDTAFDLTVYQVYRLEITPGGVTELYVNDVLQGQVGGTPADQSFSIVLMVEADAGSNITAILDVDEVEVRYA